MCAAYRRANEEAARHANDLALWCQALLTQHQEAVDELAALASKHRLLRRELDDMCTDVLAGEAVAWACERKHTTRSQTDYVQNGAHHGSETATDQLVARIAELEGERSDMQKALASAAERLLAAEQANQHNEDQR
jgi:prefoldin subunit 5